MIDLRCGDCLDLMADIEPGSIDLILCDLPYGTTACKWDTVIPFEPLWAHYRRLLKPRGAVVLTASQPFTSMLVMSNREWFKYCWVWEKTRVSGFVHAKNKPLKTHEDIAVFSPATTVHASQTDNRMTYNPQGIRPFVEIRSGVRVSRMSFTSTGPRPSHGLYESSHENYPRSVLNVPSGDNSGSFHPTQKPVALMEYLIRTYSNEGETVLDNCIGSGTTGVACLNTDRNFIGIERDPDYFAIASKRIESEKARTALFAANA
jgi:site-specific DNA-methyltransferase (adenine-specific)